MYSFDFLFKRFWASVVDKVLIIIITGLIILLTTAVYQDYIGYLGTYSAFFHMSVQQIYYAAIGNVMGSYPGDRIAQHQIEIDNCYNNYIWLDILYTLQFVAINIIYYYFSERKWGASICKHVFGMVLVSTKSHKIRERIGHSQVLLRTFIFLLLMLGMIALRWLLGINYYGVILIFFLLLDCPIILTGNSLIDILSFTKLIFTKEQSIIIENTDTHIKKEKPAVSSDEIAKEQVVCNVIQDAEVKKDNILVCPKKKQTLPFRINNKNIFRLILTTFLIIVFSMIFVWYYLKVPDYADSYIEKKKERLYSEAAKEVDSIFVHDKRDIFLAYTNCEPRYLKEDIYSQTAKMFRGINGYYEKQLFKEFTERMPNDITTTYFVTPEDPDYLLYTRSSSILEDVRFQMRMHNFDNDRPQIGVKGVRWKGIWQTGWALGVREKWGPGKFVEYLVIPYAIAFRKQSIGAIENSLSIDEILSSAYKYYTEEDDRISQNIVYDINKFSGGRSICENEYYRLDYDKEANPVSSSFAHSPNFSQYMYNDYYYVFIRSFDKRFYKLTLREKNVQNDRQAIVTKNRIIALVCWISTCGVLIFLWAVYFRHYRKELKESRQTIRERILQKCN